ncbi:hypothetical protein AVEN_182546-1 [Araneus ventricosus]|uniref:Uncharacterized protein n=1 Tax=Araneus ventricosus TaxID=182803 RepID=A0A4Y2BXN9_ARAVE|nr:hypothetical protein AVEN_182546-1 [Araneus ventricosus]
MFESFFSNRKLFLKQVIHRCTKTEYLENGKEKPIIKVENLSNLEQMILNGGIQKSLKSKTQSADSNLRLRSEGSGKTKNPPTLAPCVEARNEIYISRVGEEESGWQEFFDFEPCFENKLWNISECFA